MIVDSHVHVIAPDLERYPFTPRPLSGQWYIDAPCSADALLSAMDATGVDRAVLVQAVGAYSFDNAYAADESRARPDRFVSAACIDPLSEEPLKALEHWVRERGMQGLTTGTLHGKLGIRAGNTGLINMDNVRVTADHRIGEEGEGFMIAMSAIDQGRFTVAAGNVGLAQACLDASLKYAHERQTFGDEIGRHQLVKQMLAKMLAGIEAGRLLVWRAAFLKNHGVRNTRETSLAKWFATDHAVASALDAIQIHGANGYSNEFPVERYLRNSKAAVIYEGTSQLHTLLQADYAMGYREDRPLRCEPWPADGWERPER